MEQDVIGDKQKNVTDVTDRQHAIINLIKEHTNMTTTQMAERLGVTKRTILRDIESLKECSKNLLTDSQIYLTIIRYDFVPLQYQTT